jgi:magnesium transporter
LIAVLAADLALQQVGAAMAENPQDPHHPADVADALERLPADEGAQAFRTFSEEKAGAVLGEVEEEARPELIERLTADELARAVREMPHDRAADVLADISPEKRGAVLGRLSQADRRQVSALLRYAPDTAGGIMTDQFITLDAEATVEDTLRRLRERGEEWTSDAISYLYVTDKEGKLVGVVPLRELVFRRPDRRVSEVMRRDVQHVWVDDDQEKIARLFDRYHYLALPVLERDGRMAGIVSASQVINVVQEEATEDMQLMVGLSGEERTLTPWQKSLGGRFKWLCINLATAFLAGGVVAMFEGTIGKWTALAVFLPIIAGQGGNAAIQTLTVVIREMALGELKPADGWRALRKELILGVLNGVAIGVLVGLIGYIWKGDLRLGAIVAAAMLLNMVAAALAGVLVPFTLRALRIDPALASGILVTTVTDVAGFLFFLGLAALAVALGWVVL